ADQPGGQPLLDLPGKEAIGAGEQAIPPVRRCFDTVAIRSQLLDPLPHRSAALADGPAEGLPGDITFRRTERFQYLSFHEGHPFTYLPTSVCWMRSFDEL